MDVFVGNLPPGTQVADLERLFKRYVDDCRFIIREQRLAQGRIGHCAIGCVLPEEAARQAIRALNLRQYRGRALMVMQYFGKSAPTPTQRPAASGNVVMAARLFGRRKRVDQRRGERRKEERRNGERRCSERRVAERRTQTAPPADHPLGELRFNEHRHYQRRVGERRSGVDRRRADRRKEDRRDRQE